MIRGRERYSLSSLCLCISQRLNEMNILHMFKIDWFYLSDERFCEGQILRQRRFNCPTCWDPGWWMCEYHDAKECRYTLLYVTPQGLVAEEASKTGSMFQLRPEGWSWTWSNPRYAAHHETRLSNMRHDWLHSLIIWFDFGQVGGDRSGPRLFVRTEVYVGVWAPETHHDGCLLRILLLDRV